MSAIETRWAEFTNDLQNHQVRDKDGRKTQFKDEANFKEEAVH